MSTKPTSSISRGTALLIAALIAACFIIGYGNSLIEKKGATITRMKSDSTIMQGKINELVNIGLKNFAEQEADSLRPDTSQEEAEDALMNK